jgi:two-component system nitrogen regulation sensor histidine kinase NtrY
LLQTKSTFKYLLSKAYLLIIAAWLITMSFIIDNYWSRNSTIENVHKQVEKYIGDFETHFNNAADELKKQGNDWVKRPVNFEYTSLLKQNDFLFLYQHSGTDKYLIHWNTQIILPTDSVINNTSNLGFMQMANGYYVWKKQTFENATLIGLLPIKWNYFIQNEYLKNSFAFGKKIENGYELDFTNGDVNIHSKDNVSLFFIKKKSVDTINNNTPMSVLLRLVAVLLFFAFIHLMALHLHRKYNLLFAGVFLFSILLLLRWLSYFYPIPLNFRQFELFDPSIYSTNSIHKSLGDLLINVLLTLWVLLFIWFTIDTHKLKIKLTALYKWIFTVALCGLLLAFCFIISSIIKSMIADSQVSFDVVNFFTLNVYSAVGFFIFCLLAIIFFALTQIILYIVKTNFAIKNIYPLLIVAILGMIYLTVKINFSTGIFGLIVLVWLLLYLVLQTQKIISPSYSNVKSTQLIFWYFLFSVSITYLIVVENSIKELDKRTHYAETLATKADPTSEVLINTMLTDFKNSFLSKNFEKFKDPILNIKLKDSLVNGNFTGYTNKYDTKIYTFNANETGLFNTDSTTINELNVILNTQAKPTAIPDLYYYDIAYDRFSYISKKIVLDTASNILGYVYIVANPKKSKPETLYPELFSKGRNNSIENSSSYAFAIYDKGQLVHYHNDYPFAIELKQPNLSKEEFVLTNKDGSSELLHRASPEKTVIIAKKDSQFIESITLFSYLFCSFLLVTALFWFLYNISTLNFKALSFKTLLQVSIRNQIHGTVIFISVLSFLIIGVATILFFIKRYENNNRERLSRTIHVMANELRTSLNELAVFDDVVKIYDEQYVKKLQQTIEKIAEIHTADINVYDLDGNLKVSSLPLPYNKGLISKKMNPLAYYHLNDLKEIQFFTEEHIGNLNFVSNYIPVLDETGKEYAYLNIPYFTSQSELKKEISNFLVTIINLNAFIFLIAGIIALFITNRITKSFSLIGEKMKQVNLGKVNDAIEWKRNDEIGQLVSEYNKMVSKLDESAAALAKSEREGAWREMARQVAHEIKNPLTPMKLSLQYLQKAISEKSSNVTELTTSVANTLVEQINHLNQIAGEFSQFANIGNPIIEVFKLNDIIGQVVQLHSMDEKVTIEFNKLDDEVKVEADKTQINRLFNNLVLNAIQAVEEGKPVLITIVQNISNGKIITKVIDNGGGIPAEMKSKIFTPNFTTKTSGTGLGLAMCKGIVEQSKGSIWFETEENVGTTFFVELPIA